MDEKMTSVTTDTTTSESIMTENKPKLETWSLITLFTIGIVIRAATALHPYSGETSPPIYGDYEAQRHWMEITFNLHPLEWYKNTPDNDLNYWGLDYPPLSAYASYIIGYIISLIEPETIVLHQSRGYESNTSRLLMRSSVILADVLIFFPALMLLVRRLIKTTVKHPQQQSAAILQTITFCITLPALLLIDHAHFQYNNISIGFFLLSLYFFCSNQHVWGAFLFCLSIFFKQLILYYVLAIYVFLYTTMFHTLIRKGFIQTAWFVIKIFLAITISIVFTFAPWISSRTEMATAVSRLFPVNRGLFEDKVANVWCSLSVVVKLKNIFSNESLFTICTIVTMFASVPFAFALAKNPNPKQIMLSSSGVSLAAFLFSYQVHEKQILLPLLPLAVLHYHYPSISIWMSSTAVFSLFPLLLREGSSLAYVAIVAIHLTGCHMFLSFNESRSVAWQKNTMIWSIVVMDSVVALMLHCLPVFFDPPHRLPDLFTMLNSIFACANLCMIYAALIYVSFSSHEQGI